jgi:hypothetical protein
MQIEHVVVYREAGKFAGWPANYGIWIWGDEIVTGFTQCTQLPKAGFHTRDRNLPAYPMQARSLDGGRTWQSIPTPAPSPGGLGFSADEHMIPKLKVKTAIDRGLGPLPGPCPGGIDFTGPDFGLLVARTEYGGGSVAWFYLTDDRAHSWKGPYSLPMFGQTGMEPRTDYIINGPEDAMLFFSVATEEGEEGKGVMMAQTYDGGKSFQFGNWVVSSENNELIMPAGTRVDDRTILVAIRCSVRKGKFEEKPTWIDLYESTDNGNTFHYLNRPVPDAGSGGNPPAMIKMQDGRICLVYGYRAAPFGIHARLSEDGGHTWGEVIHLRDDGTASDLGYPRLVQRPDGTLVTVYYFNDHPDTERFIAATLWKP